MLIFALAALLLTVSTFDIDAQTRRRAKSTQPVPVVSATPPTSEPLIISRAEDFPDEQSQPIAPPTVVSEPVAAPPSTASIDDLAARIQSLESGRKKDPDQKQKRLALNLDILTKAEQRAEVLRKQLFDMIEKENTIKTRLDLIENDIRPEAIERSVAFAGSLRPEELRASKRKTLEIEKTNLQSLLTEIQRTRSNLDLNLQKADGLVERLRTKLEKEIDAALADDEPENNLQ